MLIASTVLASSVSIVSTSVAHAQEQQAATRQFSIPTGPLAQALNRFADAAGLQLIYDGVNTQGLRTTGLSGTFAPEAALSQLLAGTGLNYRFTGPTSVTVTAPGGTSAAGAVSVGTVLETIEVQGAQVASSTGTIGEPPAVMAGGQVAKGARLGVLGNKSIFDAPVSVVAITEQTVKDQQARTIAEVLKNDASVAVFQNTNSSGTDDVYSIRGFLGASSNTSFDGLFGLNWRQPGLEQIERVEISKGPSALLYGQSGFLTIGGNINLVPKRAGAEPLTEITTRYISDGTFGTHLDVGRRFGEADEFGVRVNGVLRGGDANIDEVEKSVGFASAAFDYEGEDVRATLDLDYSDFETDQYQGGTEIVAGIAVPRAPENSNYWNALGTELTQNKARAASRVEYDLTDQWTLSVAGGLLKTKERYRGCGAIIQNSAGDVLLDCDTGATDAINRAAEAVLRGEYETGSVTHRTSLGVSYNDTTYSGNYLDATDTSSNLYNPSLPLTPTFPATNIGGKTSFSSSGGLFLNHELSFFDDRLMLLGGLRQTVVRTASYNGTTGATTASYREDALTPAVGIVVKPLEYLSIYGNYIEALEAGGTAPTGTVNAGAVLAPLVSKQIEVGAKLDMGNYGATLAAFQITRQNAFTDTADNTYKADGEQVNKGIEATVFGEPVDGLRLIGGVMFIEGELTRTAGGTYDGNDAIGVPDFQGRLSAEWDVASVEGLTLTGSVIHTGGQYVDQNNTQTLPSWTRLDLGARYKFMMAGHEAVLRASVENVFDTDYWASVDRGYLYAGGPRTFLISTSFKF
jgi:iron complex outermembrane receptor protein